MSKKTRKRAKALEQAAEPRLAYSTEAARLEGQLNDIAADLERFKALLRVKRQVSKPPMHETQ